MTPASKERPILFSAPMVRAILERHEEVRRLHAAGSTAKELAAVFGCSTHPVKQALKALGLKRPAKRRSGMAVGDKNPAWRGGRRVRPDGYIAIWTPDGERLEHQVVMEKHLGRSLREGEVVHHRDEVKSNNDISNLKLTTQSAHIREHLSQMHRARYGQ